MFNIEKHDDDDPDAILRDGFEDRVSIFDEKEGNEFDVPGDLTSIYEDMMPE